MRRIGGGIHINTRVVGVPQGSGLGTSSILAAACAEALFDFMGERQEDAQIYRTVLCMEQLMSTGGGWQDQVGGVTDGIKLITSKPGLVQNLQVDKVNLSPETLSELNKRFVLVYTGQRRLARNLLRDVVGRYLGNEPEVLSAMEEIQIIAHKMRKALEEGKIDEFGELLSRQWVLSQQIDEGTTNKLIDTIFESISDLTAGIMICGAGGGGFLQVLLKKEVTKKQLGRRLLEVFTQADVRIELCEIV
ncbi:MAG: hypothetical protein IJI05_00770 [Erysipelotrichaceae bacterium]|nr:hypothetical protein [Erysipelotrichaceae bacterium]